MEPEPRRDNASPEPWWLWTVALALVVVAYHQTILWLVANWLANSYYSHGFIVPAISVLLAFLRLRGNDRQASSRDIWMGIGITAVSLIGHLLAMSRGALLLSALTIVPLTSGLVLAIAGSSALRRCAFAIGFLAAMMPLPILEQWTPALARWITGSVGDIGRLLGLDIVTAGARIEMPKAELVVGAPCSGVNSVAALVTLAALFAYLQRGSLWARSMLVILAVPIALVANWLRVLILVVVAHSLGVDAAMLYFHDWSSLVLFGLATLLLALVAKVLQCQVSFDTLS